MQVHLVTGGAGFLGSHLIDRLMKAGEEVICLDNYFTGRKSNIAHWIRHPRFELIRHDVTEPINPEVIDLALGLPGLSGALPVQSGQNCNKLWDLQHAGASPAAERGCWLAPAYILSCILNRRVTVVV